MTMPKIVEIGTRELDAIRGVVAKTLPRIVEATPGTRWKTTGSAGDSRDKKDGQDARDRRPESSPHPALNRSNNCECTQVDDDYSSVCALLDAAPVAIELTGQTIDCNLLQLLILRVTLAHLACMSTSCLTPERGRRTISMKQRRVGFGQWVLNTRP